MWNLISGAWTIAGFIKMYTDKRKRAKLKKKKK